jgi:hypothetical protein
MYMQTKLEKCDLKSFGDFIRDVNEVPQIISRLRLEVTTTMTRRIAILWDARPCNLIDIYWHFGETLQP